MSSNGEFIMCFQQYQEDENVIVYHHLQDKKTEIHIEDRVMAIIISSDNRSLIYSNDTDLKFIDIATGEQTLSFENISERNFFCLFD